jgi:peptide deformylase
MQSEFVEASFAIDKVITNLRDTAATLNNCAGLAAPQIGHMVRIILVNVQGQLTVMINPEYLEQKGKMVGGKEGCFSRPSTIKKPVMVRRFNKITIQYEDEEGYIKVAKFKGFEARLIQHEVDHLNGILI